MTKNTTLVLGAIVITLVVVVGFLQKANHSTSGPLDQYFLTGFAEDANLAQRIDVFQAGSEPQTIQRESDQWVVAARDNYAADFAKLSQVIVALADAKIVEEKTSNPDLYEKLGVDDPEDGGSGTKISIAGENFSYAVILGETAQGERRYARSPDNKISYLIDQNPNIPQEIGDWLLPDVIDIDANRIRSVSVVHADGEAITIEKSAEDLTDFTVLAVPDGRELNYATVGNGIAAVLSDLKLDDVRTAVEAAPETSVVFDAWDGLRITAEVSTENDESWVTFVAEHVPGELNTDVAPDDENEVSTPSRAVDQVAEINGRLAGWQYRIPEHKKNLLTRRWDDILKSAD